MKLSKYLPLRLLLSVFLCVVAAFAQEQEAEKDASQPAVEKKAQPPVVRLSVLVTDGANRAVMDLQQADFRVSEDGKAQTISSFSLEELPVSYGIVVDASGSMRALIAQLIETGKAIVEGNQTEDETFIMRFVDTDNIDVEQGFTSDKEALSGALDSIFIEGGTTAVLDAVNRAIEYHRRNRRGGDQLRRHAMVLITDGEDRGSQARNMDALLARVREEDIQFFIVGLTHLSEMKNPPKKAVDFLTRLAESSGGRAFFPKSASELQGVVDEIKRDLHKQYLIGYTPTNAARTGTFRKVQVSVADAESRKKLNVITRSGYIAR